MTHKIISVIIPTLNRPADLKRCLDSLVVQTLPPDELIIVDQSSDEQTKNLLEEYRKKYGHVIPSVIYIHQAEKSSARARNLGASLAKGEILSFTDDDIILYPDYLEKIMVGFKDPRVGGVMGNVENPIYIVGIKGFFRRWLMRVFLLSNFKGKMTVSGFGYPIFERKIDKVEDVHLFPGYSMNFRRELFLAQQFDNWFSGYSFREDVDLSYRISQHAKLIMVPDARFYHNHSQGSRLDLVNLKKMQFKNFNYLFKKHRPQTLFYRVAFAYSLFGILFIDFVELILNWTKQRQEALKADLAGISDLKRTK